MKKATLILGILLVFGTIVNAQTKVEVKKADLPKAIVENIAKDYAGYSIQNAFKVTKDKQTDYDVVVLKGADKEKLEYSADGKFLKKEAVQAHTSAKKVTEKKATGSAQQAKK